MELTRAAAHVGEHWTRNAPRVSIDGRVFGCVWCKHGLGFDASVFKNCRRMQTTESAA